MSRGYEEEEKSFEVYKDLTIPYYESKLKHTLGLWDAEKVYNLIKSSNGEVIAMDVIESFDDLDNPISVISAIAENLQKNGD